MTLENRKLRMAVFCNGYWLTRWQKETIHRLMESGLVEFCVIVMNDNGPTLPPKRLSKVRTYLGRHFFWKIMQRFVWKIPALAPVSVEQEWQHIPVLSCRVIKKGKYSEYFSETDITAFRDFQPDFALRFGFNIIRGDILEVPRYGIWSYHHGDEMKFRGGPLGFWEIYRNSPLNGVVLQKLNHLIDAGVILDKREYRTVSHSYPEHAHKILSASTDMPLKVVRRILGNDDAFIFQQHSSTKAGMNTLPGNLRMLHFMLKICRNRLAFYREKYFRAETWMTGYSPVPIDRFIEKYPEVPVEYIRNGNGKYYADPFIMDGKIWAENYDYRQKKGKITLLEKQGNSWIPTRDEFTGKTIHLAYPFIFSHEDIYYMIPETAQEGNIQLYVQKNDRWEFLSVLLEIPGVDSSLVFENGRFWLFTGLAGDHPNEKLYLFSSEKPEGPYHPHPMNPVITDPQGSRMGGNFIRYRDLLLRPAQYSLAHYGQKIVLKKITVLNEQRYAEEDETEIVPVTGTGYTDGLHTLAFDEHSVVFDVKKRKSNVFSFVAQFRKK